MQGPGNQIGPSMAGQSSTKFIASGQAAAGGGPVGGFAVHLGPCVADTPVAKRMETATPSRSGTEMNLVSGEVGRPPETHGMQKLQLFAGWFVPLLSPFIGQLAALTPAACPATERVAMFSIPGVTSVRASNADSNGGKSILLHPRPTDSFRTLRMGVSMHELAIHATGPKPLWPQTLALAIPPPFRHKPPCR